MSKLKYTFKTDTLFKMLFVQYPELLKKLVAELLGMPLESHKPRVFRAAAHNRHQHYELQVV